MLPVFALLAQIGTFVLKVFLMCWVFVWVRWTLPRFRYDQLMNLGWKVFLPLALAWVFFVSFVLM